MESNNALDELIDNLMQQAKINLENDGQLVMCGFAIKEDTLKLVPEIPNGTKEMWSKLFNLILKRMDADFGVIISEIWMVQKQGSEIDEDSVQPKDDPENVDAIMITARDKHGKAKTKIQIFIKENKKITYGQLINMDEACEVQNNLLWWPGRK